MTEPQLLIAGLGPGSWDRTPLSTREVLCNPQRTVVVRTLQHPAAQHLAGLREVISCDDLYEQDGDFDHVYQQIAERVLAKAAAGATVYAVPGSPRLGELAVALIRQRASQAGVTTGILAAESFLDAVLDLVGYDPLDRGLRLLNGHRLPAPLVIDGPTLISQVDHPVVMAETLSLLGRVLPEESEATIVVGAGDDEPQVITGPLPSLDPELAGPRTSLFLDPEPGGLVGVVRTMWQLREECPWDRQQTHESLVKNLIEEAYELIEAIAANSEGDAYGAVEDELGDVLLQVLFHAAIARQQAAFDIEDVAENLRQKLVRRHPHVFGQVEAGTAEVVKANWEKIKEEERGTAPTSILDGVPIGMPALERAAKLQRLAARVGFDWPEVEGVINKLEEEVAELRSAEDHRRREAEVGDLLFTVVNLARHLAVDPELALRGAIERFVTRFRHMEEAGPLEGLTLDELDHRWEAAKRGVSGGNEPA
ncbi:MAG TPA: nucleoside triphosphate pyrophosphohydrolase [Acidimicrobiia bacterium]|nr:nucleoside triphosphate pyrophosphohydrolase [Acidimicrobiia bacterium]